MAHPLADSIMAMARDLAGTPFHHQGRLPGCGLDCAGVPITVAQRLGLLAPAAAPPADYARTPDGRTLQALCEAHMQRIDAIEPGAVVLVAWLDGPPQHLGIVTTRVDEPGAWFMVHAEGRRHRGVMETRLQFGRAMRLVAVYRMPLAASQG